MKRLDTTEIIFKVLAYTFLTIFALMCLYPFVYAISAAVSDKAAYYQGEVVLFPVNLQFDAFRDIIYMKRFWISYSNTLFVTFYGTIWALGTSILGAYALSKNRLIFRRGLNFYLVFTLWFSAGLVPQFLNYKATQNIFGAIGVADDKWLIVIAMGMAAFNVVLLRNAFENVPYEIEEAGIVDGANDFQLLSKVFIPMSKSTIATVGLFFGISRWNGYFWARTMTRNRNEWPLQVFIRDQLEEIMGLEYEPSTVYAPESLIYAMVVCAIIPIIIIYPYIQKYFAKGVNVGGVKE
ncbi:MAG: carbohydrate ABC transporter permease [Eubacteriales bacterium]